ncbi:response regulator of RpoS [Rubripirellula tenax]|uniref:Response regulator of RpoS n=1 Tax=Rubripirellula tenax TaxID=2528015 RepID=A0A5C6EJF4_9BACT|nr:response regulator [Rubripirellula tenax]TWU47399.1 response regulator of RpoS [Rubripirellula tenax]
MNILLIDDDIDFGETMRLTLSSWGHRVTLNRNWLSLMRSLKEDSYDLIIADIETPTGNGLTAFRFLNEDESVREIELIFVSGLNDAETLRSCQELGAGHIHKSSSVFEDVRRALTKITDSHVTTLDPVGVSIP